MALFPRGHFQGFVRSDYVEKAQIHMSQTTSRRWFQKCKSHFSYEFSLEVLFCCVYVFVFEHCTQGCRIAEWSPSCLGGKAEYYMPTQEEKQHPHSHLHLHRNARFASKPHVHVPGMWEDVRILPQNPCDTIKTCRFHTEKRWVGTKPTNFLLWCIKVLPLHHRTHFSRVS